MHFDLQALIQSVGLIGIFAIVFIESGLLVGFFLPGDSLLFTAGFLASQDLLPIVWLVIGVVIMAILGDQVGYFLGKRYGRRLFSKPDSRFFKQEYLHQAERFYHKYGPIAIVLARFTPVVRTFAPVVAGVGNMSYVTFVTYNILGGVLWGAGLTLLGYVLGSKVPSIDKYLFPVLVVIILLSIMPGILHFLREPERRRSLWNFIRRSK